jgi:hypothetical protein
MDNYNKIQLLRNENNDLIKEIAQPGNAYLL